jgi:hypothetical protein
MIRVSARLRNMVLFCGRLGLARIHAGAAKERPLPGRSTVASNVRLEGAKLPTTSA